MRERRWNGVRTFVVLVSVLMLATPLVAQERAVAIKPVDAAPQKFTVLSYNTLDPNAVELRFSHNDPARTLLDIRVDNEADFDLQLANKPDSVTVVTHQDDALARHADFLSLAASYDVNIMVAVHGDLDELEQFALATLGVSEIADRIAAPGTKDGMLIVQYLRSWNFGYLLGEETYNQGGRSTYPSTFPIAGPGLGDAGIEGRGPGTWIIINLIRAALEEPFWNRMHYLSGETLGCLGVDWDTAFKILWKWEVFEQWLNGLGLEVGEDIWGVIWDLIWGMVGYIDGATGWWDW